jgi:kynureninase
MSLLADALARLGDAPLTESALAEHVFPLFSKVLARDRHEIYLANHSLGRPLDQTADDVAEGIGHWFSALDDAWDPWWQAMSDWRAGTAHLANAPRPDCIVPKSSAGQGVRAVLNSFDTPPRVLTTEAEFDSLDHIFKQYASRGRAHLEWIGVDTVGHVRTDDLLARLADRSRPIDLLVVSHVFFATGQVLDALPKLVAAAHAAGTRVLLDAYHSYGVLPLDLTALDVDYAVAGSYKYLRGGPGCCWLYVHPRWADGAVTTLDTGWFAKREPFAYRRPMPPEFAQGGDGWLESTMSPQCFYQARAGLEFVSTIGVDRLRAYSMRQKRWLSALLTSRKIRHFGCDEGYGAFVTIPHADPMALARHLKAAGVNGDARAYGLRLCPDILNTQTQLEQAVERLAALV